MWSISTNIPTVLANFLGIHNSILSKNIGHNCGNTNSVSRAVVFKLVETLKAIKGPCDDIPEDAKIFEFKTKELPGLFVPCHCVKLETKIRIMGALKFRHEYLWQPTIKKGFKLTCSDFKRPHLVKTLEAMEETIRKFRILTWKKEFLVAVPEPEKLTLVLPWLDPVRLWLASLGFPKGAA